MWDCTATLKVVMTITKAIYFIGDRFCLTSHHQTTNKNKTNVKDGLYFVTDFAV